jgi:hypothetical protein
MKETIMTVINKTGLLSIACAVTLGLGGTLVARPTLSAPQSSESVQSSRVLFVIERRNTHLGGGVAISPDGRTLVFVGNDNGLYVHDLETDKDQLLLKEVEPGLDVFNNPTFSPDGRRVLFSASGGTYYYPSNIYSVEINGSGLKRLTRDQPLPPDKRAVGNAVYAQYFYSAQFAPDMRKILLHAYDAVDDANYVAAIDPDGSHMETLTRGKPLFWGADGQGVYYIHDGVVKRFDLRTKETRALVRPEGKIVGRLPDKQWLLVDTDKGIDVISLEGGTVTSAGVLEVPRAKSDTEALALTSAHWSRSKRAVLVYEGATRERIEVVQEP